MGKGIGGHTRAHRGATDDWITPPHIVGALGRFDLDPCACIPQPWPCADTSYNLDDDGLARPWAGRIWLNPLCGAPHNGFYVVMVVMWPSKPAAAKNAAQVQRRTPHNYCPQTGGGRRILPTRAPTTTPFPKRRLCDGPDPTKFRAVDEP